MPLSPIPLPRPLRFLGSVQFAMVLLVLGAVAMAAGTVIEASAGRSVALGTIYASWWFDLYLLAVAVNLILAVVNRIPINPHQWSFVVTHASIVLILAGAWVSRSFGYEGKLVLREGQTSDRLILEDAEVTATVVPLGPGAPKELVAAVGHPRSGQGLAREADGLGIRVLEHEPYGLPETSLVRWPGGVPGLQFRLEHASGNVDGWLLAEHREHRMRDYGPLAVELVATRDAAQLEAELAACEEFTPTLVLGTRPDGPELRLPLSAEDPGPHDLGGVQVTLRALYTRAQMDGAELREAPAGPPNPAAVVEVRRNGEVESYTLFGLFPEYGVRRGGDDSLVARLRLEGGAAPSKTTLRFLISQAGDLYAQVATPEGREAGKKVAIGAVVPVGGGGLRVTATSLLLEAAAETHVTATSPNNDAAVSCLKLGLELEGRTRALWLAEGTHQRLVLAGHQVEVGLRRRTTRLPFAVKLSEFDVSYYPGSRRPASYASQIVLSSAATAPSGLPATVSMNRPLDFEGYRLFQSGYLLGEGDQGDTTILRAARDPGVVPVYMGFVLLIVGVGWYLLADSKRNRAHPHDRGTPGREERELHPQPRTAAPMSSSSSQPDYIMKSARFLPPALLLLIVAPSFTKPAAQAPRRAGSVPVEETGAWAIQADGRIKPLETYAREFLVSVSGRADLDGLTPLEVLWGYHLEPAAFRALPSVKVSGEELKAALDLPRDVRRFSFERLLSTPRFQQAVEAAKEREAADEPLTSVQEQALGVYARLERVAAVMEGSALRIVPAHDAGAPWETPEQARQHADEAHSRIYDEFVTLAQTYGAGDAGGFAAAADRLTETLRASAGPDYPGRALRLEVAYNHLDAFGHAWKLYLGAFLVILFFGIGRTGWGYRIGMGLLGAGLLLHSIGFGLRWAIAGRAPVSDMYESLVFMAGGAVALAAVMELLQRRGYFGLCGGLAGFLALAFAHGLPIDSSINPLVPVLANTSWLSIHVMTVMLSYSAFALAMVLGHVVMGVQLFRPGRTALLRTLSLLLHRTLQVGLVFLAAGICFGAIWANRSWGRYWGWDPKETWSLITFFAYLGLVHARFAGWLHHFGTAVWSVLCFLTVVMTYYGVNFVLGTGLHSYGFGSGGTLVVVAYLVAEAFLIGAATWRYRSAAHRRPPLDALGAMPS